MNVYVIPQPSRPDRADGGIRRVVEAQIKHLPTYGVNVVDSISKADLVHTHAAEIPDVPVGMPWIVSSHGLYWAEYEWPGWGPRVNAQVIEAMKRCDHVTAPSEWVAYALKRGMWLNPTVLYHGIDPDLWNGGKNQGYVLWNKARTDSISDPTPMDKLASVCPEVQFVSTFGKETKNVLITGKKPFEEAIGYIQNAGVYLATTRETFGIGTLEAMACGVPILGWKWGGQAEIIKHLETGYLAQVGDYEDLKKGLYWCFENRDKVGKSARQDVLNNYTWEKVMASYAELYFRIFNLQEELNEGPKVSIVSPCYNLGYLLPSMVKSVQDQTMENWELIIVDDCSTDDSHAAAKKISAKDNRIRVVKSEQNLKLPGALNLGLSNAKGRYTMNLDPDNMIPPNTLKILSDALDNDRSIHVAYGRIRFVLEDGITNDPITQTDDGISGWPPVFNCAAQFKHRNQIPSTCLSRREVFERTGGYRDRAKVAEDAEHNTRVVSYGFQPKKVTDSVTYVYRYRPDSKSRSETESDWTAWFPWAKDFRLAPWGVASKPPQEMGRAWPVPSCEPALVTVVIPVGPGHEKLVIDALDSVEAQTFRDWHCIVVNDTGHELKIPHIWAKIITTEGGLGPSPSRNLGISQATTKAIVTLDADDILEPTCLRKMYTYWKEVGDVVYSQWWDDKGETPIEKWNPPEWKPELLVSQGCIHASCAMFDKTVWERVGGYDVKIERWEDWDFQIAYAMLGICAYKIEEPLFTYRKTTGLRREDDMLNKRQSFDAMKAKWPEVFDNGVAGTERMKMGCSGCSKKKLPQPAPMVKPTGGAPSGNVTLIQYTGPAPKSLWLGKVTRTKYIIGRDQQHSKKWIYNEDVPSFLAMKGFNVVAEIGDNPDGTRPSLSGVMEG